MRKKLWFIIITELMLLQVMVISAECDFDRYFPTNGEFESMNLYSVSMYDSHNFRDIRVDRYYYGKYSAPDAPSVVVVITIEKFSKGPTINSVMESYRGEGYQCSAVNERTLECTKVKKDDSAEWNPTVYQYHSYYRGERIIGNVEVCADDPSMLCSETTAMAIEVFVNAKYNTTNPLPALGRDVLNLVSSKVSGEYNGSGPQVQILSPADGQTIYFEPGKPLTFEIRVKVTDSDLTYAEAHYESGSPKVVMVGGELQPKLGRNGGVGSVLITLEPDYLGNVTGVVKAYAKDEAGNDVEKSITVHLREKTVSPSASPASSTGTPSSPQSGGEVTAGDPSKFGNLFKGFRSGPVLRGPAKLRMKATLDKLKGIGSAGGLETVEVKTPYGRDVKVVQKDKNVKAKRGSSLWFKLKYYAGSPLIRS
jgi:hypothetical protein